MQIELGGEGATVKVDSLAEPIVFDIPFDDDPTLEAGYDPGTRTGTCYNRSQVLTFDCDVPTTFDCGEPRVVDAPRRVDDECHKSCPSTRNHGELSRQDGRVLVLGQRDEQLVL